MAEHTKEQIAEIFEQHPHLDKLHFTEDGNFHTTTHEIDGEHYAPGVVKFVDGQNHFDKSCKIVTVALREDFIIAEEVIEEPKGEGESGENPDPSGEGNPGEGEGEPGPDAE